MERRSLLLPDVQPDWTISIALCESVRDFDQIEFAPLPQLTNRLRDSPHVLARPP
jgi:hypothetical protein